MYKYADIATGEGANFLGYPYLPCISEKQQQNIGLAKSYAFVGQLIKHPDFPIFAYFTFGGEYLQIIEIKDSTLKEVIHLSYAPPVGKLVFVVDAYVWSTNRKSSVCFSNGTASKNYIYLLYSGKLFEDENKEKCKYILVLDWKGNKIKMIELDVEVYSICIDKEDEEIFAYTTNNNTKKNEIIRFKL
jgi:hypothetical protein